MKLELNSINFNDEIKIFYLEELIFGLWKSSTFSLFKRKWFYGFGHPYNKMAIEDVCVYAALILNDDGIEITPEKVHKLLDAAGVKMESYLVDLFAEYFKSHDITELIKGACLGGAAPAAAATGEAAGEAKEEEKKEEEEVVEMAGGFDDLFG